MIFKIIIVYLLASIVNELANISEALVKIAKGGASDER